MPTPKAPKPFKLKPWDKALLAAGAYNVATWARGYFDYELFPWQQYFIHYRDPAHPTKDKMGVAGIRVGKSFTLGISALWFAQYHPGSRYLNACISVEQAKIVYHTCIELASRPRFAHWIDTIERSPYPAIKLVNGSELWFRSVGYEGEMLRGFEFDFISLDEASYIASQLTVDTLKGRLLGINPITKEPRAGWFWQVSSPKGKNSWTYDRWKKGDPAFPNDCNTNKYLSLRVRTTDNPLLDQDAIADLMASYSEKAILQELMGEFIESDNLEFSYDSILHACFPEHPEVMLINQGIEQWRQDLVRRKRAAGNQLIIHPNQQDIYHFELDPQPGHAYLASWDLGKKSNEKGRNATVGMLFDITDIPWKLWAYRYETGQPYIKSLDQVQEWYEKYQSFGARCRSLIDATGKGDVVNEIALDRGLKLDPLEITGANKPDIIAAGRIALERERVRMPFIRRFVDEMSMYERYDKELAQDTVMTFCMAMYRIHDILGMRLEQDRTMSTVLTASQGRPNYRHQPMVIPSYLRYRRRRIQAHQ